MALVCSLGQGRSYKRPLLELTVVQNCVGQHPNSQPRLLKRQAQLTPHTLPVPLGARCVIRVRPGLQEPLPLCSEGVGVNEVASSSGMARLEALGDTVVSLYGGPDEVLDVVIRCSRQRGSAGCRRG